MNKKIFYAVFLNLIVIILFTSCSSKEISTNISSEVKSKTVTTSSDSVMIIDNENKSNKDITPIENIESNKDEEEQLLNIKIYDYICNESIKTFKELNLNDIPPDNLSKDELIKWQDDYVNKAESNARQVIESAAEKFSISFEETLDRYENAFEFLRPNEHVFIPKTENEYKKDIVE